MLKTNKLIFTKFIIEYVTIVDKLIKYIKIIYLQ